MTWRDFANWGHMSKEHTKSIHSYIYEYTQKQTEQKKEKIDVTCLAMCFSVVLFPVYGGMLESNKKCGEKKMQSSMIRRENIDYI